MVSVGYLLLTLGFRRLIYGSEMREEPLTIRERCRPQIRGFGRRLYRLPLRGLGTREALQKMLNLQRSPLRGSRWAASRANICKTTYSCSFFLYCSSEGEPFDKGPRAL